MMQDEMKTMYDRVGGLEFFEALTERFYRGVAEDPVLRPLYPEDLSGPRRHLCLFLAQFWGGPAPTASSGATPAFSPATYPSRSAPLSGTPGSST